MSDNITIIEPKKGWIPVNLREIWAFRELLYFLAWRDVKVKYRQAAIGVVWAVLSRSTASLAGGMFCFEKVERYFADVIQGDF